MAGIVCTLLLRYLFVSTDVEIDFDDRVWTGLPLGPALIALGLAMVIFPGGPVTVAEVRADRDQGQRGWGEAPIYQRWIWGVALVAGFVLGRSYLVSL